jgi:hypothetical protein
MNLTPEHQKELAQFPAALKALVEAELAAGNTIVEIGGGHPAPPVGACVKLANKVSTRARDSGDGLDFYERNSSSYSGEFTDAKRFFFVLEPPNPPPPYPDMDAIRKSLEPKPDPLARLAQREAGSRVDCADDDPPTSRPRAEKPAPADKALTTTESATGARRLLYFRDRRPPQEVQFALERELMVLFAGAMDEGQLRLLARGYVNGACYFFELRFEAATLLQNCYSLRVEGSWAEHPVAHHEYFRKTSESWFKLWTRDLRPANPPKAGATSSGRYRKLAEAALKAEAQLDSVPAIQQAIVAGLMRGGTFATSHKEGGTNIFWRDGKFIRSDYGEYPDHKTFSDEAEFLKMLRRFCQFDVTRNSGTKPLPEFDEWKLILRRMQAR